MHNYEINFRFPVVYTTTHTHTVAGVIVVFVSVSGQQYLAFTSFVIEPRDAFGIKTFAKPHADQFVCVSVQNIWSSTIINTIKPIFHEFNTLDDTLDIRK